jgi:hypothetical protein
VYFFIYNHSGQFLPKGKLIPRLIGIGNPISFLARHGISLELAHELVHDESVELLVLAPFQLRQPLLSLRISLDADTFLYNIPCKLNKIRVLHTKCWNEICLCDVGLLHPWNQVRLATVLSNQFAGVLCIEHLHLGLSCLVVAKDQWKLIGDLFFQKVCEHCLFGCLKEEMTT